MTEAGMTFSGGLAPRSTDSVGLEAGRREGRVALVSAAGLYAVGAALTASAALLPHVSSPAGVGAIAATAVLTAAGLTLAFARGRRGLTLAWAADLWGVLLVALLCAATGGGSSPFALIYFFAIGHAAAFQPRGRLVVVAVASLVGFLAPLAYSDVSGAYGAIASVGVVLALLAAGALHLALERIREQRWRLEFLIAATANFDTSLDPQQTLRKIAGTAVPELAELCVIDLIDVEGSMTTTVAAAVDPALATGIERLRRNHPLGIRGRHPVARALRAREPFVVHGLSESGALQRAAAGSDEQARFLSDAGCRAAAVFPMIARGRMLGAISFLHVGTDARYRAGQLAVLEDLTGRAALAFDNARLYAERARVAHTLRRSLMPAELPTIAELELASFFQPMGAGTEVGGDFYDVFEDGFNCWLVVGDVCGKGADAAVLTGFLRHTIAAYAREGAGPASVLERVNRAMLDQDFAGRFATVILARLEFRDDGAEATVAVAGHPLALLARANGGAEEFGESGTLLGVFAETTITERSTLVNPGDALALYTDGLSDAHEPERTLTPQEMLGTLSRCAPCPARAAIDALLELVDLERGARDDIAILAARVRASGEAPGAAAARGEAEGVAAAR